ncbi:MAG: TlpA disulfide reductase family protein, partial [Desulfovibrionaceae bacterium]|nr:TlpA disulfide reductase family protein [Desulfovibrionaceae bacterium]
KELRALIQKNKGKPVILNFFATWCPPCRAEIPMLVEMNDKYDGRVTFIGLTVDDARSIAKVLPFMARMGIDYPVYHAGSDIVQNFSISSIPFNVGYDKKGKMVFAYSGIVDEEDFDRMLQDLLK